jgi:bifunctional NMN adenylyltransferase/nudix hydrolase
MNNYAVYIGRFQPFHHAHLEVCHQALRSADKLILLVGSSQASPSIRNPFSFAERKKMIEDSLSSEFRQRTIILPIPDYFYSDNAWVAHAQQLVTSTVGNLKNTTITLVGYKKDHTSYYLDLFPTWQFESFDSSDTSLSSTHIREYYFDDETNSTLLQSYLKDTVPEQVVLFLQEFQKTNKYKMLCGEYKAITEYKKAWSKAPFPPTFITTDAVVTCGGHVLLITRKAQPGAGLLALPGGFINQEERLEDGCLRELKEETRIKIPLPVLRGSIVESKVFDHPLRSVRGRTVTHAYYINLQEHELPKVKGGDDASHAAWVPLSWIYNNPDKLFEDHYQIIIAFLGRG